MRIDGHECTLMNDGGLDTIISVDGEAHVFGKDYTEDLRDPDTGKLTDDGFVGLCKMILEEL